MSWLQNELTAYFQDRDVRHVYVDEFLNEWLATQIKVLREQRDLKQTQLENLAGLPQGSINKLEDVTNFEWDLLTLKKLAEAFDVPLDVSFTTFGQRLWEMENFGRSALERVPFTKDPVFLNKTCPVPIDQSPTLLLDALREELKQKKEPTQLPPPEKAQTATRVPLDRQANSVTEKLFAA